MWDYGDRGNGDDALPHVVGVLSSQRCSSPRSKIGQPTSQFQCAGRGVARKALAEAGATPKMGGLGLNRFWLHTDYASSVAE